MATTTGQFNFYDHVSERSGDGGIIWDTHTFQMLLVTNAYVPNAATHTTIANITGEVVGNGYSRQTLTTVTWGGSPTSFNSDDVQYAAAGGDITARRYVLWDQTADLLVGFGLLDNTDQDVTTTDGNTLDVRPNAAGYFVSTLIDSA